ncbi:CASP-like protein 4B4 [Asparagus officinalis]|uniref:CASP-like protein 4B4 n=1 Tax=Asparagus officinalis TaxID=4686 RepID=UPI00098E4A05|nr:CASP-like protein 4B4 [Asparagus officinalis]
MTWLFSLIAAIVMATNKHGDWKEFNNYEEYKYLVAIDFMAFLYSWIQLARFSSRRDFVAKQFAGMFDFVGDQVVAYLLMSVMSAAIPMTNRMREGADNMFTDASVASISMTFFAFASSAVSALISGYKFSRQNINIQG